MELLMYRSNMHEGDTRQPHQNSSVQKCKKKFASDYQDRKGLCSGGVEESKEKTVGELNNNRTNFCLWINLLHFSQRKLKVES